MSGAGVRPSDRGWALSSCAALSAGLPGMTAREPEGAVPVTAEVGAAFGMPVPAGPILLPETWTTTAAKMTGYEFRCKDIGMECGFELKGASSKDEVMQLASIHARVTHNMQKIPDEVAQKVSSAIRG